MAKQDQMEEEFLSCYICFDVFKEPKTLTCLHRFCERCLHNYIIGLTTAVTNRKRGFPCPVCREFIASPDPRRPPSDWAALLRTDFHLKNLIKFVEHKTELLQVGKIEHPCQAHKDTDCDLFCVDCTKIVCHLCAGIAHRGCNQVVTLIEAAEDRRATLQMALQSVSSKLDDAMKYSNFRERYMSQLDRRKCAVESEIQQWAQEIHQHVTRQERLLLENLHKKYDIFKIKVSAEGNQFEDSVVKVKNHIKTISFKREPLSDFDLLKDNSICETIKMFNEVDLNDVQKYRQFVANLSQVNIILQKSELPSNSMGDIVFSYDNKHEEDSESTQASSSGNRMEIRNFSGDRDKEQNVTNSTFLRNNEQQLLVPSVIVRNDKVRPSPPVVRRTDYPTIPRYRSYSVNQPALVRDTVREQRPQTRPPKLVGQSGKKAALLRSINSRFREDAHDPKLRDLIVVALTNTIIVTDWANQSVKAFHSRREKDSRLVLGGKPWAITQLSDNLAAVSLPLSKQICIIKTVPFLSVQNSFMSAKNYSGLATLNSSMLVASGGTDPPAVDIINLYGEVLKSFTNDSCGIPMFRYPAYVSVTPGMFILVSDRKRGAVICMSHTGEIKFTFQPDGARSLKEPSGVISDPSGRIFLVESRGLLLITPDGQFDRALLRPQDGVLHDPRGVALDSEGLVYLTSNDSDIKVFKVM